MNIKLEEFPKWYNTFIQNPYECELLLDSDNIILATNSNRTLKVPNGLVQVNIGHNGGIIVGFPNNITYFKFTNRNNNPQWLEKLVIYLQSKGLNATHNGNDLLVDGYKVAGYMNKWITRNIQWYGIHISLTVDNNLIKQVCSPVKEMNKIPKGLSDYDITREELLEVLEVDYE